ncbi:MAG: glycosyltransferase family 4 protein [Rhodocyclaceae bacterium]
MSPSRPMRTLLFSTLYPSSVRPHHGIFVETRLRHLLQSGQVDTRVVAPVPWFPSTWPVFGQWGRIAATPDFESRNGVDVHHPRYPLPPKVGMHLAPWLLAWGARASVARLLAEGWDFDLIDAHYFYPDGVAASILARWFNKPFVVTARGSDLTLIPRHAVPRHLIRRTTRRAAASIGVSASLAQHLRELGADDSKLHVMRNGVDLSRFSPQPREALRAVLGVGEAPLLLSVGHLIELKGHHVAIEALAALADRRAHLVIVGEGPERTSLQERAQRLGVGERVHLAGAVLNEQLATWYSAADVLVLASSREGWPNVLLESMACGTPVVATRVGGTPEIVASSVAGRLVDTRAAVPVADAIADLLAAQMPREAVRAYAEGFSWQQTTDAQLALFRRVIGGGDMAHA